MDLGIFKSISEILKPAAEIVDQVIVNKQEKQQVLNELESIKNTLSAKMIDYEINLNEAKSKIIQSETVGTWLQRSWRPILMLAFGFILIYEYFISSIFSLPKSNLPEMFWELLNLGLGGYIIGRSAEKIVPNLNFKNKNS